MTDAQLKKIAIDKLASHGVDLPAATSFRAIAHAIGVLVGSRVPYNQGLADYVRAWAAPAQSTRYTATFRPMAARVHPRDAEIERGQPPLYTPNGIGNGTERVHGFGRGGMG